MFVQVSFCLPFVITGSEIVLIVQSSCISQLVGFWEWPSCLRDRNKLRPGYVPRFSKPAANTAHFSKHANVWAWQQTKIFETNTDLLSIVFGQPKTDNTLPVTRLASDHKADPLFQPTISTSFKLKFNQHHIPTCRYVTSGCTLGKALRHQHRQHRGHRS